MDTFEKGEKYIMNTYSRFPIALESGDGMYVYDENGKKYLDFIAGIAVNSLGHGNKDLVDSIANQSSKLIHCSNLYWTKPQVELAEKLVTNSCFDKVFFCNSGAEAVESSLKLIRKYGNTKNKNEIITMQNSFHGRTYGAITATGQEKYQKGLHPLLPGIKHVEYNNFDALLSVVTENTAGILLEPIQGEGGIKPADPVYLKKVREFCDENDILLAFDEVQCGMGRCGYLFAYEYFGVKPDIIAIAKGVAGGVPMGAMLATEKVSAYFQPGDHASTFGGNPLAAAAANVVTDKLLYGGLLENVRIQSEYLQGLLNELKNKNNLISDVRGVGLLLGVELSVPAAEIIKRCMKNGLLVAGAGANVVRFVPALVVQKEHIDEAVKIFKDSI